MPRPFDVIQAGVATRDDEHDRRQRHLAVVEDERLDVAGKVMHGHKGEPGGGGRRLGERHADEQGADQAGPLGHRHGAEVVPRCLRVVERALDDAGDVADMLAGRQLGNDASPITMDGNLRGNDVRADRPGLEPVPGLLNHSGGSFVAGSLDAEDAHATPG